MARVHNYYAGPAALPLEAIKAAQEELLDSVRKVAQGSMVLGTGVAERVVSEALAQQQRDPLTEEERLVLLAIAAGAETNDAIAEQIDYSAEDVTAHLKSAIDKLGAKSRAQATLIALRAGWITVDEAHQM